jgi:hypothetical protein
MVNIISSETINLLEQNAATSEPCRLIKLAISNGLAINQIAELADVSRATISNWIQGNTAQEMSVSLLKKRLIEKGFLTNNETRSRFSIPEIRNSILLQKSIERIEKVKLEKKAAEEKRLAIQLNREEERKRIIFIEEYGRKMLETAINGKTQLLIFNYTQNQLDLDEEASKRGFGIIDSGGCDFDDLELKEQKKCEKYLKLTDQKLSELDQKNTSNLKNKIHSPYRDDDPYILKQSIFWIYPQEHDEGIKDCIHAKFLDWISDLYGRELISKIFPLIESCDLDNKKEVKIAIDKHKTRNEYTDNEIKDLIQIFNIDIPFSLRTVRSMFNILNYETEFIKTAIGDKRKVGELIVRWS